jgi:hypothetical protein
MMYKAKVAVCSEIRTKHSTHRKHHLEFLNVKPGGTYRNRWALKGYMCVKLLLMYIETSIILYICYYYLYTGHCIPSKIPLSVELL